MVVALLSKAERVGYQATSTPAGKGRVLGERVGAVYVNNVY